MLIKEKIITINIKKNDKLSGGGESNLNFFLILLCKFNGVESKPHQPTDLKWKIARQIPTLPSPAPLFLHLFRSSSPRYTIDPSPSSSLVCFLCLLPSGAALSTFSIAKFSINIFMNWNVLLLLPTTLKSFNHIAGKRSSARNVKITFEMGIRKRSLERKRRKIFFITVHFWWLNSSDRYRWRLKWY